MPRFVTQQLRNGGARRLAGALLLSLAIALVANAATPRSVCACSNKTKAYRASMKADLRNLVTAQEAFFDDSARFAESLSELDSTRFRFSTGVELVSLTATATGFDARVSYPSGLKETCAIAVGPLPDGSPNPQDGEPQCDPQASELRPVYTGVAYGALWLLALVIRIVRAGSSLPPISGGTVFRFFALTILHPYWPHNRRDFSCYSNAETIELYWVLLMAGVVVWMLVRRVDLGEPPHPA